MQIGTEEVELRRAEVALGRVTELGVQEQRPVVPADEIDRVGPNADRSKAGRRARSGEQAHGVRPELERCTDRLDRRGLLEHLDLDALRASASAAVRPPIPPPTIAIFTRMVYQRRW